MSGEFGRFSYHGYIQQALSEIAEDCRGWQHEGVHASTYAIGEWLDHLWRLLDIVANHEAGDHYPSRQEFLDEIDAIAKSLQELRVKFEALDIDAQVDE